MEVMPVDWLANVIIKISREVTAVGATFHLCNPRSLTYENIAAMVCHAGYPLKKLKYAEWRTLLFETVKMKKTSLDGLLSYFSEEFHLTQSTYSRENTERFLSHLGLSDLTFPEQRYIDCFVRYMESVGHLSQS
jgi:hypothetical protein